MSRVREEKIREKSKLKGIIIGIVLGIICLIAFVAWFEENEYRVKVDYYSGPKLTRFDTGKAYQSHNYLSNKNTYSDWKAYKIGEASSQLYEVCGLQMYCLDLEVDYAEENISSSDDAFAYCMNYADNIVNDTYGVYIISMCNTDKNDYSSVSFYDALFLGEDAERLLGGQLYKILNQSFEHESYSSGNYYLNIVECFLNHTYYATKTKFAVVFKVVSAVFAIALIAYLFKKLRDRKYNKLILKSSLDELEEDAVKDLQDKYR